MYRRLYSFLNLNNVFTVHQLGFHKVLNTSDALAELSDIVYSSINKNNSLIEVYPIFPALLIRLTLI